jgi:ribonuclease HII
MLKRSAYDQTIETGVDEAGRGCLMGPVVAAAVVLPTNCSNPLWAAVKDSKKLSEKKRATLAEMIRTEAHAFGIGFAHADEIDEVNILQATFKAMHRALDQCYFMCLEKSPTASGITKSPWKIAVELFALIVYLF